MVHLHIPNLATLLQRHYQAVGPLVRGRAQLYAELLEAEFNASYLPMRPALSTKRYKLHGTHINSCVAAIRPAGIGRLTNDRIFDCLIGTAPLGIAPVYASLASECVRLLTELQTNAELLLTGEPADLETAMRQALDSYPALVSGRDFLPAVRVLLAQVFNYDYFSDRPRGEWGAFMLTQELGVSVCPYCNLNYTLTVREDPTNGGTRAIRPNLDHFFSQARNPLLAVSFYNLIPCCSICNSSLKGDDIFTLDSHIHPYVHGFGTDGRFRFDFAPPTDGQAEPTVKIRFEVIDGCTHEAQITGSISSFLLTEIYQYHTDLVQEMRYKKNLYSDNYLKVLAEQYEHLNISPEELYRQAFGAYLHEQDFGRRPLSKLIRDLALDMEMLPQLTAANQ